MAGKGDDWDWYKKKLDALEKEEEESIITTETMCEFNAKEGLHSTMRSEWRKHLEDKSYEYDEDMFDDWAKHIEQARAVDKEPGIQSYLRPFWIKPREQEPPVSTGKAQLPMSKSKKSKYKQSPYFKNLIKEHAGVPTDRVRKDKDAYTSTSDKPKVFPWAEYDYAIFKKTWSIFTRWVYEYNHRLLWVLEKEDDFSDMAGRLKWVNHQGKVIKQKTGTPTMVQIGGVWEEGLTDTDKIETSFRIKAERNPVRRYVMAKNTLKVMNLNYDSHDGSGPKPLSPLNRNAVHNFIYWCDKHYMTMSVKLGQACIPFDDRDMEQNSNLGKPFAKNPPVSPPIRTYQKDGVEWTLHREFRCDNLSFPNLSPEDGLRKCLAVLEDIRQGIEDDKLEAEIEKWYVELKHNWKEERDRKPRKKVVFPLTLETSF